MGLGTKMPAVGRWWVESNAREAIGEIANDEEQHSAGSHDDAVKARIEAAARCIIGSNAWIIRKGGLCMHDPVASEIAPYPKRGDEDRHEQQQESGVSINSDDHGFHG